MAFLEIKVDWAQYQAGSHHPMQGLLDTLRAKMKEHAPASHEHAGGCTYVYHGCGSCGEDGAQVDAYCTSGGSEPDYSWCEPC